MKSQVISNSKEQSDKGAAMIETGLAIALVAILAIGATEFLGVRTLTSFQASYYALDRSADESLGIEGPCSEINSGIDCGDASKK